MGYKKSFNLVTLQLIIPLSTMTKAEYKNAYGIDLDDIDIEKVTLLQDDGSKNKYFVDEIKATESGIDIYAGGKILSIGETSVSVTSGAYSVENAKPIYYHPILIFGTQTGTRAGDSFSLVILNNSSEAFTSLDSLVSYLRSANISRICPISGVVMNSDKTKQLVIAVVNVLESSLSFRGQYVGDVTYLQEFIMNDVLFSEYTLQDGVNKIN